MSAGEVERCSGCGEETRPAGGGNFANERGKIGGPPVEGGRATVTVESGAAAGAALARE